MEFKGHKSPFFLPILFCYHFVEAPLSHRTAPCEGGVMLQESRACALASEEHNLMTLSTQASFILIYRVSAEPV